MWTKSADFLPMIESGKVWLSQDVELLSNTQFANFGHWVEWLCSVKNFPVHSPCGSPRLAFPNVLVSTQRVVILSIYVYIHTSPSYTHFTYVYKFTLVSVYCTTLLLFLEYQRQI